MEDEDLCFRQSFQHFVRDFCTFHENFAVDLHYELEVMGSSRDTQLNYGLCIPSRYPIGEITHGDRRGERIFSKQKTPSMYSWCEVFESYFGHYVRYDEADEKIAFVEFREGQVDETGDLVGVVSVLFQAKCEYPFPRTRSREHDLDSYVHRYPKSSFRVPEELFSLDDKPSRFQTPEGPEGSNRGTGVPC